MPETVFDRVAKAVNDFVFPANFSIRSHETEVVFGPTLTARKYIDAGIPNNTILLGALMRIDSPFSTGEDGASCIGLGQDGGGGQERFLGNTDLYNGLVKNAKSAKVCPADERMTSNWAGQTLAISALDIDGDPHGTISHGTVRVRVFYAQLDELADA